MVGSFQQVICWQPRTSGKKQTTGNMLRNQRQGLGMQDHFPTNNHSKSRRCVKPGLQIHAIDDPRKQTLDKSFVRGVGKFPTDSAFGGTCKVPTRTRQFSDSFSLSSQFSNSVHRVWWKKKQI